ncbi:MAG: uroporphyrinogen decarboxylase family protein [Eubacteriales bacterium]|nr:uroporphyrinogen decarboxylase family protein [Eubacteriales bacterium]
MSSNLHTPITPKENYIRAAKHQNPLWLPMKSDSVNFAPRIYPDNVARAFVIDGQPYEGPVGGADIFGVVWKYIPVAGGSMVEPGNPFLEDISEWKEKVHFPDLDSWDWEKSAEENREFLDTDKLVTIWIFNGLFERLISFVDFEAAAIALVDEDQQDDVRELFQALVEFYKKLIDKFVAYYNIDAVFFHDDWGSQRAAFFSLDTCREMLVPYMRQIVDHCHSKGLLFDFHCCGKNEALVPAMLECGMDIWGGQPMNDKQMLTNVYGEDIMIGVHVPFGPNKPIPEDDDELYRQVEVFLQPYAEEADKKPIFLMDLKPDERVRRAFYKCSSKLLMKK